MELHVILGRNTFYFVSRIKAGISKKPSNFWFHCSISVKLVVTFVGVLKQRTEETVAKLFNPL